MIYTWTSGGARAAAAATSTIPIVVAPVNEGTMAGLVSDFAIAPESSQTCLDETGQKWRCGEGAALVLQDLIGRRTVTCDERDIDVRRCLVGGLNVNEWLVAQSLALAYRRYSHEYIAAEQEARAAARGMWAGTFEPPWEWRRR